jgi:hypothetical protein
MTSTEEDKLFKEIVKISDEEDRQIKKLIKQTAEDICTVFKTPKLDKEIKQGIVGDVWYQPPRFINNNHAVDLVTARALPSSSKIKLLNKQNPIHKKLYVDDIVSTIG